MSLFRIFLIGVLVSVPFLPVDSAHAATTIPSKCRAYVSQSIICISKPRNKIYAISNGVIIHSGSIRYGIPSKLASDKTKGYLTREGTFYVGNIRGKDAVSNLYSSDTGRPIGMPYFVQFSRGQGIHYSTEFAQTGYTYSSHGCVNLRSMKLAKAINSFAKPNMPVIVIAR